VRPMGRLRTLVSLVCALVLAGALTPAIQGQETKRQPSYRVQPGDILQISVWKEEGLDREVLVRPDGGISFPLVGDVDADGKAVEELRTEIAQRIERYIPDPVVTVEARQILGSRVYVIGKVNRPGAYVMSRDLDVMQALSVAGGTTSFAALNNIQILRRTNGKQIAIPFRYGDVEHGRALEQNILLRSGDILVVP
jgi:polysaccharide export outer membrane protein